MYKSARDLSVWQMCVVGPLSLFSGLARRDGGRQSLFFARRGKFSALFCYFLAGFRLFVFGCFLLLLLGGFRRSEHARHLTLRFARPQESRESLRAKMGPRATQRRRNANAGVGRVGRRGSGTFMLREVSILGRVCGDPPRRRARAGRE